MNTLSMIFAICDRISDDPEGVLYVKRITVDAEGAYAGFLASNDKVLLRTLYCVRIEATRRRGPYDNITIMYEGNDEQEVVDAIERLLEAA